MKKAIFILACMLLLCNAVQSQSWTAKRDIPATPATGRWGAQCFSLGGKIYLGGGYIGNLTALNDFWEYDPAHDQWTQRRNIPGAANRTSGIAFAANGKGYVGLGSVNYNTLADSFLADLWEYDPASDTWAQKASLPDSARHAAACFVVGTKAYVVGGLVDFPYTASNDVWEYDAVANKWTSRTPYPAAAIEEAMAFAIGSDGYVVGGSINGAGSVKGTVDSATYKYNTTNNTWQRKGAYCTPRESGVGFALNGIGYVGLGKNASSIYREFCKYNPAADKWDTSASYPAMDRSYAAAAVANGKAYVGGGFIYTGSQVYFHDWAELSDGTTGIGITTGTPLDAYPNPARDVLYVSCNKPSRMSLINVFGQCVARFYVAGKAALNVASLPDGLYLLQSEDGKAARIAVRH